MAENLDYRQLIDDYLSGNITPENRVLVKNKLTEDPEFKNEFELQRSIVNAIRDTRRLELKTRLENVKIHWFNTIPNSWKIAATVSAVTLTTISAYFYFDQRSDQQSQIDLSSNNTIELKSEADYIPQKPTIIISEMPDDGVDEVSEKSTEKPIKETEEPKVTVKKDDTIIEDNMIPETNREVEVIVPDLVDDFEGTHEINMEDASNENLNKINPVRKDIYSNTEVKTLKHKKYDFHYQLSDGMLTLYGNFEDIPYEILEINSLEGKRLFLNYKNNYYMLLNTGTITDLRPVTDTLLINELNIVKENK